MPARWKDKTHVCVARLPAVPGGGARYCNFPIKLTRPAATADKKAGAWTTTKAVDHVTKCHSQAPVALEAGCSRVSPFSSPISAWNHPLERVSMLRLSCKGSIVSP